MINKPSVMQKYTKYKGEKNTKNYKFVSITVK